MEDHAGRDREGRESHRSNLGAEAGDQHQSADNLESNDRSEDDLRGRVAIKIGHRESAALNIAERALPTHDLVCSSDHEQSSEEQPAKSHRQRLHGRYPTIVARNRSAC